MTTRAGQRSRPAVGLGRSAFALGKLIAVVVILIVVTAGPALADPAEPTNYRSIVNTVEPAPSGVTITVVGGDAFLSANVAEGHTVEVPGYFGEPYLRIDADGSVWLNVRSPARYINRDRYGASGVPDSADAAAEPEWEQIASSGSFTWHDHRVHWMSPDLPPTIGGDRAEIVFPWRVPVLIDGVETEVSGELLWFPSVNPLGPILIGAIAILAVLAWRPGRLAPVAALGAGAGALALLVAVAQYAATPGLDRGAPAAAVIPALAIVAAVAALWLGVSTIRTWALVGFSGFALVWWAWGAVDALTAPVLPSALPVFVERTTVALAGWVGVALVAIATYEFIRLVRASSGAKAQPEPTSIGA